MPRRLRPKNAFKRGIDERDTEYLLWALIEQAREDYFPEEFQPKQTDEDGNPILVDPMMSIKELMDVIKEINRQAELKRKAGLDEKPAHQSADKALEAYRKSAAKKKTL